jgi:two-component system, LytTR family, response regulator LytT
VSALSILAVDDEQPALDELCYLLKHCGPEDALECARDASDALRLLRRRSFDVVLLDVRMPGLDGIELASILARFSSPPAVVFVTAYEDYALDAFDVNAVSYLLKPVSEDRLAQILDRVRRERQTDGDPLDSVAVELPGRTMLVSREDVEWVEAAGDYIRLHTSAGGSHLVRLPLAVLEERWSTHGFVRIHRGYLVSLRSVRELRTDGGQNVVRVNDHELPVSRRHLRDLRDRLVRHARPVRPDR